MFYRPNEMNTKMAIGEWKMVGRGRARHSVRAVVDRDWAALSKSRLAVAAPLANELAPPFDLVGRSCCSAGRGSTSHRRAGELPALPLGLLMNFNVPILKNGMQRVVLTDNNNNSAAWRSRRPGG